MSDNPTCILQISNCEGYAANQVTTGMTLGQLRDMVREAIEWYGEDAPLVTEDRSNRAASFGTIVMHEDIEPADLDNDED